MASFNHIKDVYEQRCEIDKTIASVWDDVDAYTSRIETIKTHFSVYKKDTKSYLNGLAEAICARRDYTSAMVKNSKKSDLPSTLINVYTRLIDRCNDQINTLQGLRVDVQKTIDEQEKRKQGRLLFKNIASQREQYIDSFETVTEGKRAWECLESLVCDGTVGINDLESYGIKPPVIL